MADRRTPEQRARDDERAVYVISVAAELAGVHPQTLRIYERKGLLRPQRTSGNTRRYSERDIELLRQIQDLTQEPEIGKLYMGTVRKIMDFGAFVEIFPGTDGLIHISELANRRVARVEDVLQEGDEVLVKVIGLDKGKIKLSRKEAIADEEKRKAAEGVDKKAEALS